MYIVYNILDMYVPIVLYIYTRTYLNKSIANNLSTTLLYFEKKNYCTFPKVMYNSSLYISDNLSYYVITKYK